MLQIVLCLYAKQIMTQPLLEENKQDWYFIDEEDQKIEYQST